MSNILRTFCLIEDFYFIKHITKDCIAIILIVILIFFKYKLKLTNFASLVILLTILLIILLSCLDLLFEK